MNTINNKFSFARLGAVLKCDLVEHRMRYLGAFLIMFTVFLVFQFYAIKEVIEIGQLIVLRDGQFHTYGNADYIVLFIGKCLPCFYGVLILALMCAAADMSSVPLRSKAVSTNYLMMPASNLEKFLSRAFINTIIVIVMAYVALLCADLVRMLSLSLLKAEMTWGFTVPRALVAWTEPLKEIYIDGASGYEIVNNEIVRPYWEMDLAIMVVSFVVILFCWSHSLFILSGCFWRKRALVKMFFAVLALILFFVWLFAELEPQLNPWFSENVWPWLEATFEKERYFYRFILSIGIPLFLGFIALNWWLSYRLFSRKQMISRTHLFGGRHLHEMLGRK